MDNTGSKECQAPKSRDLGERFWLDMSPWSTDRSGYGGPVHRVLGDRDSESSSTQAGRPDWRCGDERASAQGHAEEPACEPERAAGFDTETSTAEGLIGFIIGSGLLLLAFSLWLWSLGQ